MQDAQIDAHYRTAECLVSEARNLCQLLGTRPEVGTLSLLVNAMAIALADAAQASPHGGSGAFLQQGIALVQSQVAEITPVIAQMRQRPTLHA